MATQLEINAIVQENRLWIVNTTSNAKETSDFPDANTPLVVADKLRVVQGGSSKKVDISAFDTSPGIRFVENFLALPGQTSYTVSQAVIANDGLWTVQVGSELWNSRTGITSFTNGNITIDFINGVITFHFALTEDAQVIIKHN